MEISLSLLDEQNMVSKEATDKVVVKKVEEKVEVQEMVSEVKIENTYIEEEDSRDDYDSPSAKICVFGVGGGGGNAVKSMMKSGIRGVEFITANTDIQALSKSPASKKIQIGKKLTRGLGAGAKANIGEEAAQESLQEIREAIGDADMVFITAGMGGGTGTGAAPIIAKAAKDKNPNIVTVGVVTKPFNHEGPQRNKVAEGGIKKLAEEVDSLIVIPNQRLLNTGSKSARVIDMFLKADEVLCGAVRGISELITGKGYINTDFADVQSVMGQRGMALMGIGKASGENRATEAARMAIESPLLEDISIQGARGIVVNVTASEDILMDEYETAMHYITNIVDPSALVVTGLVIDDNAGDDLSVTVVATGLDGVASKLPTGVPAKNLNMPSEEAVVPKTNNIHGLTSLHIPQGEANFSSNDMDAPAYLRNKPNTKHVPGGENFVYTDTETEVPSFIQKLAN